MEKRVGEVKQLKGDAVANASVRVLIRGTQTLATLHSANNLTATLANPITTNTLGTYEYYAPNGRYDEEISVGGQVYLKVEDIKLYDKDDDPELNIDSLLAQQPPYAHKSDTLYLTGRQRDLSNFSFRGIWGNGALTLAEDIRTTHVNGLSDILTRATDANVVGTTSSRIPEQDRAVWDLALLPTHIVSAGRPRTQIVGYDLEPYTPYRVALSFKLKQPDNTGWNNRAYDMFESGFFSISQQSEGGPETSYSEGQDGDLGGSPVYIKQRGGYIFPDLRVMGEDLGLDPDDLDATVAWPQWEPGDTVGVAFAMSPIQRLTGPRYQNLEIFITLDDRSTKRGGKGMIVVYFNGRLWFRYSGRTVNPRNAYGNLVHFQPRVGFYETVTNTGTLPDGTAVNTISSCNIPRVMRIRHYSMTKVGA